jgi:hypothetical protein
MKITRLAAGAVARSSMIRRFQIILTDKTLKDDGDRNKMYWRWIPAAQNDFAARWTGA